MEKTEYGSIRVENKNVALTDYEAVCSEYQTLTEERRARWAREKEEEIKRLFDNFDYLWQRRHKIIGDVELSGLPAYFAGLSLAYIGGGPLTLGMLFELWSGGF